MCLVLNFHSPLPVAAEQVREAGRGLASQEPVSIPLHLVAPFFCLVARSSPGFEVQPHQCSAERRGTAASPRTPAPAGHAAPPRATMLVAFQATWALLAAVRCRQPTLTRPLLPGSLPDLCPRPAAPPGVAVTQGQEPALGFEGSGPGGATSARLARDSSGGCFAAAWGPPPCGGRRGDRTGRTLRGGGLRGVRAEGFASAPLRHTS